MRARLARGMTKTKAVEERYVRSLQSIMRQIHKAYEAVLIKQDALDNSFDMLGTRIMAAIPAAVTTAYGTMSAGTNVANKQALSVVGITPNDAGIGAHIVAARDANIRLVESAHQAYAADVRAIFSDPENYGRSQDELRKLLVERGNVSESRAALIARDQTLKLNGQMMKVRQQNAGITSYTWSTSGDDRVRDEHAALEGEQFDWTSPPAPGHPGEDIQCRCVAIPFVEEFADLDEETASATEVEPVEEDITPQAPDEIPPEEEIEPKLSFEVGVHAYGIKDTSNLPPEQLTRLTDLLVPDAGHAAFLKETPLTSLQFHPTLPEAWGLYHARTQVLEVATDRTWNFAKVPLQPGVTRTISEAASGKAESLDSTLIHEFGHHIHAGAWGSTKTTAIDKAITAAFQGGEINPISTYARTNHLEYFAETYAAYRRFPDALAEHDPVGYTLVERVLKIRGIR